jgi:topoisomerase-4 subunit A
VPPEALMEQLFRLTELETRLALNMNVLDAQGVPRVMGLRQVLEAFIAHRMEVLVRRSRHRLARIEERLEILDGFLVVFLDLDRVIRIIREHDEPRPELIRAFALSERQAEAILNLRLRNLRRLEELELKRERDRLRRERKELTLLLGDEGLRRDRLREEMLATRDRFAKAPGWARRTSLGEAPTVAPELLEAPVERVPMTVACSRKGWIRAVRGRVEDASELKYKEGDGERLVVPALSTDKLDLFTSDGRCYQLAVDRLPGGRGLGEPLGLLVELAKGAEIVALRVHGPEGRILLATAGGRGFVAELSELAAQTRAGKQVVNLAEGDQLAVVAPVEGDHVVTLGQNLKLLIFPLAELPVMGRGRGVTLQRYKGGGLAAAWTLSLEAGLSWAQGQRTRQEKDLRPWLGQRGGAGRLAPRGFPREGIGPPTRGRGANCY